MTINYASEASELQLNYHEFHKCNSVVIQPSAVIR